MQDERFMRGLAEVIDGYCNLHRRNVVGVHTCVVWSGPEGLVSESGTLIDNARLTPSMMADVAVLLQKNLEEGAAGLAAQVGDHAMPKLVHDERTVRDIPKETP